MNTAQTRLALGAVALLLAAAVIFPMTGQAADARRPLVDCAHGDSLSRALRAAKSGSTLYIRGTCNEQVRIVRNRVRLIGLDGATINGNIGRIRYEGTLTIAAQGVRVTGLIIENGPDQGIAIERGASATLTDVHVRDNATAGVTVDGGWIEVDNVRAANNGSSGFDFFSGATVIGVGPIFATANAGAGVALNANSMLELRGSIVTANDNAGDGLLIVNDSDLLVLSFPEAQGSGVVAQGNGGNAGVFVANSSVAVVGSQFFGEGNNVFDVQRNNVGMLFTQGSLSSPFANAQFLLRNNAVGLLLTDGAHGFVVGGLQVTGNAFGILADGAGVLHLQQSATNESSIVANHVVDAALRFGTRAKIQINIPIDGLSCDASVVTPEMLAPNEPPVYACP